MQLADGGGPRNHQLHLGLHNPSSSRQELGARAAGPPNSSAPPQDSASPSAQWRPWTPWAAFPDRSPSPGLCPGGRGCQLPGCPAARLCLRPTPAGQRQTGQPTFLSPGRPLSLPRPPEGCGALQVAGPPSLLRASGCHTQAPGPAESSTPSQGGPECVRPVHSNHLINDQGAAWAGHGWANDGRADV